LRLAVVGCWLAVGLAAAAPEELANQDFRQIIRQAKDGVFPAVVFIKCIRESLGGGKRVSMQASGSGVIISPSGEALTNHHVVEKAVEIRCLLFDGRACAAKLVGSDKDTDLALLQLGGCSEARPLPHAAFGESSRLTEGDYVMAMGAPWGLTRSVSIGIVACTRRYLPGNSQYSLWLQTDASISPGNSGGPLINTDGKIVGVNTIGVIFGGDMGFAIPSDTIKLLLPELRRHGRVSWSWSGLHLQALRDFHQNIFFDANDGVIVASTDPESPARRAGIRPNDRLVKVNGESVRALFEEDLPGIRRRLGLLPKLKPAKLELIRDERWVEVELTPREKGSVEGEELDCPRWDMTVKSINQFDNPGLFFYRKQGVFVYGVNYPGNAAAAGLQPQDILLKVDGREVKTLADLRAVYAEAVERVRDRPRISIAVLRRGLLNQFVLNFVRDYTKE